MPTQGRLILLWGTIWMRTARLSRASLTFADVELSEFSAPPSGWIRNLVCYKPHPPTFSLAPKGSVLETSKLQGGRSESLWAHSQFLFLFCTAAANLNPIFYLFIFPTGHLPVLGRCLPKWRPARRSCGLRRHSVGCASPPESSPLLAATFRAAALEV